MIRLIKKNAKNNTRPNVVGSTVKWKKYHVKFLHCTPNWIFMFPCSKPVSAFVFIQFGFFFFNFIDNIQFLGTPSTILKCLTILCVSTQQLSTKQIKNRKEVIWNRQFTKSLNKIGIVYLLLSMCMYI